MHKLIRANKNKPKFKAKLRGKANILLLLIFFRFSLDTRKCFYSGLI